MAGRATLCRSSDLIDDPKRPGLDEHIADLEAERAHLGLKRLNLLGNSWGGLLVAAYAAAHSDRVERVVMYSPAGPTKAFLAAGAKSMRRRAGQRLSPAQARRFARIAATGVRLRAADPRATCREWATLVLPLMVERSESSTRLRRCLHWLRASGAHPAHRQRPHLGRARRL